MYFSDEPKPKGPTLPPSPPSTTEQLINGPMLPPVAVVNQSVAMDTKTIDQIDEPAESSAPKEVSVSSPQPSKEVCMPPPQPKPSKQLSSISTTSTEPKRFGLITRKDLLAQMNASRKRKQIDLDDEDDQEEPTEQKPARFVNVRFCLYLN